jgi:hypothetical protein
VNKTGPSGDAAGAALNVNEPLASEGTVNRMKPFTAMLIVVFAW